MAVKFCCAVVAVEALLLSMPMPAFAQATPLPEAKHDVSGALSDIPAPPPAEGRTKLRRDVHRVKSIRPPGPPAAAAEARTRADAARQTKAQQPFQPASLTPIPGISSGDNGFTAESDPPDTNAAVGRTQVVEWVNTSLAVFDKQTRAIQGHVVNGNALFKGFGGDCQTFNDGDPIVAYDKLADRWVLSQFAVTGGENGGSTFSYCVAVSQTTDATGKYNRYEFQFPDFDDYPKMSVWPDGYYVSFNMFNRQNKLIGAKVCALPRTNMLAGQAATGQCFDVPDQAGLLPADLDGTQVPPAGTPNYVVNFDFDGAHLNFWKFHVDWANASNSTFTKSQVAVTPFTPACDSCIAEPSGGIALQSLGDRLMFRLAYRRIADHESLVVNHSVSISGATGPTGVRWYELRNPSSTPTVFQQGTYAPDASFRWMGSTAMDKVGNLLIGYSVSSKKQAPSIAFAGRMVNDPPGQLSAEHIELPGKGVQTDPDRWGDYASVTLDPVDDCTFYFATQYLKSKGHFNWQTQISRFKFPNCQ